MDIINSAIEKIRHIDLKNYRAVVGFDAVIDYISRPIKHKTRNENEYFRTIEEFGDYISSKKGLSGVISIKRESEKIGGNMAILSNSLGSIGIRTDCIGTFGTAFINPIFNSMKNCKLHSIGETNICTALEFDDGKIMLADMTAADNITWEKIKDVLSIDKITELYMGADIIGLVNWRELKNATQIWHSLYKEIIDKLPDKKKKLVCIDITDFSYRMKSEVLELLDTIYLYLNSCKTVISINENESRLLYRVVFGDVIPDSVKDIGDKLYEKLKPYKLVIHPIKDAHGWDVDGYYYAKSYYTEHPKLSTGAGDNFNAGLCLGLLAEMPMEQVLVTANAVSGFYVRYGYSPTRDQLVEFMELQQAKDEEI